MVLETIILPLNYRPTRLHFSLFMDGMFFTPFAILFEFKFPFLTLFSASVIIDPFADGATHFY